VANRVKRCPARRKMALSHRHPPVYDGCHLPIIQTGALFPRALGSPVVRVVHRLVRHPSPMQTGQLGRCPRLRAVGTHMRVSDMSCVFFVCQTEGGKALDWTPIKSPKIPSDNHHICIDMDPTGFDNSFFSEWPEVSVSTA